MQSDPNDFRRKKDAHNALFRGLDYIRGLMHKGGVAYAPRGEAGRNFDEPKRDFPEQKLLNGMEQLLHSAYNAGGSDIQLNKMVESMQDVFAISGLKGLEKLVNETYANFPREEIQKAAPIAAPIYVADTMKHKAAEIIEEYKKEQQPDSQKPEEPGAPKFGRR